jgi:deoxyribodipyrimidine photo-lyase
LIVRGKPEYELFKLAQKYQATKVFAKKEVAYEEKQTEERVEKELWKSKCELKTFSTSTLYHAQDLPFSIKDIPDVFTNFRKRTEKESQIREIFPAPKAIKSPAIPELILPRIEQLGLTQITVDQRSVFPFKGGETEAYKRLNYYFNETKFISTYKETRNELINRYLKHYKVKYIKDLDEVGKKFLDTALQSNGYKITSKRMLKGEQ